MHQDITTRYLGLNLRSPMVIGACPLNLQPETVRALAISGAGGVVLPSLMEEQVEQWLSDRPTLNQEGCHEQTPLLENADLCRKENEYNGGVDAYLRTIPLLKEQSGIPLIASLNGYRDGEWLGVAKELEHAGADAIEVAINASHCDPAATADQVERPLLDAIERVTDNVTIPVAVKLLPFYTTLPNLAWRLAEVGAEGVVLFGREPVWEFCEGELVPTSHWQLSSPGLLQTTLSGLLRVRSGGPNLSVAASGGIATTVDVIHAITAGADIAMITSEIYRTGPDSVAHLIEGISAYLTRHGFHSFTELVDNRRQQALHRDRRTQVEPMLRPVEKQKSTQTTPQQGDRWGHPVK
ncbi:MAG: dihydroorotate dehydrogenase [Planctomycetota bacterium]